MRFGPTTESAASNIAAGKYARGAMTIAPSRKQPRAAARVFPSGHKQAVTFRFPKGVLTRLKPATPGGDSSLLRPHGGLSTAKVPVRQLVYLSDATPGFTPADLKKILDAARLNNREASVTGLLLVEGGQFLQALEGEPSDVAAIFERIRSDPRHHGIAIQADREVSSREFGNWSMAANDGGEGTFGGRVEMLISNVTSASLKAKFNNFADYV
jgi:hypothetical protein